ncbi:MAG: FAD:protein FMN transferase [Candidatus Dormibacter sp.]
MTIGAGSGMAPAGLTSTTGRAFATTLHVVVTLPDRLHAASHAVDRVVADIDRTCSRFRGDSEITRLQARAGAWAAVSPLLFTALRAALRGAALSEGAVDPTVGTAVKTIGYVGDFATVARDRGAVSLRIAAIPGWRCVRLDEVTRSVLVPAGVEIDLGATAKALASDLAASAALDAMGGGGVLVNLGGDIAVAGEPPADGWVIQVSEASDAPIAAGVEAIAIRDGGVATSTTTIRRWRRGTIDLHHIVDPSTGLPAAGPWRTVTCIAGTCLDANIAATAAIVKGAGTVDWLSERDVPGRLISAQSEVARTRGWPHPAAVRAGSGRDRRMRRAGRTARLRGRSTPPDRTPRPASAA